MPERPMGHVIFGRPEFRRPNGSAFGLVESLHKRCFIEMALLQEVEDDGLHRLCVHGSPLSYGATTTSLARALNQAVDARTLWSAARQGEQPRHYTPGDSPRRTSVWSPDIYRL